MMIVMLIWSSLLLADTRRRNWLYAEILELFYDAISTAMSKDNERPFGFNRETVNYFIVFFFLHKSTVIRFCSCLLYNSTVLLW
jgi:hypothetical protein